VYRKLDPRHIGATALRLRRRIEERFGGSGLAGVAQELEAVTQEATALAASIQRPQPAVRATVSVSIALLLGLLAAGAGHVLTLDNASREWSGFFQGVEALVNDIVFVGVAIYFLLQLEPRWKRRRILKALHTLRSLVHIVDMHQLTKDPEHLLSQGPRTASSPLRSMTSFELTRYLDYCSELLAIIGKVAALYVQDFDDPIALSASSSVQDLAVSHSRAIWQKLMILDRTTSTSAPSVAR
jgi:hypothetical protein